MSIRLLSLASIVLLAGCGGDAFPTVPLNGSVTVDGTPVERGNISFAPLDAKMGPDVSASIAAGKYEAKVPKGKLRVFLQGTRETGKMIEVFGKQEPEVVSVIPRHYAAGIELDTTTLSGERNFELNSSPDSSR